MKKRYPRIVHVGAVKMFQVLDRELAKRTASDRDFASICVSNIDEAYPSLAKSEKRQGALLLKFDDIPHPIEGMRAFSQQDAERVLDFYEEMRDRVELFIVNCEMGKCRSAAIAAALSKISNGNDTWFKENFDPNPHVYDTLMKTWRARRNALRGGKQVSEEAS